MDQAKALKAAREAARMSQAHLAAAAGVSKRTVIRAEQGGNVQAENLRCLCSVLGLDAAALTRPTRPEPITPVSILREHVARYGEEIVWEGAPDQGAWRRQVRYRALLLAYLGLGASTVVAGLLYGMTFRTRFDGEAFVMDGPGWLALAGILASIWMLMRVLASFDRMDRTRVRLPRVLHVLTDKAFYTAELSSSHDACHRIPARIERVELPESRDGCVVEARSIAWPMSRSIRLRRGGCEGPRVRHVEGIPDLEGLAGLMRGEARSLAA